MEQQGNQIEALFIKATEYANNKLELTKLKAVQKTSSVFSSAASFFTMLCIALLFLFVANIGLGLFLGELLGKGYYGFFVLSGFYLLLGIVLYSFRRKWIKTPVSDAVIKTLTT